MDKSSDAPAPHSRYSKTNGSSAASRLSIPDGDYMQGSTPSYSSTMTFTQYLTRLVDYSQMDVQAALDQMRSLVSFSTTEMQKVYKMAYYRKQTKNHWARDDPCFVFLQIIFLTLSSLAYCIAFRSENIIMSTINFSFHSIFINFLLSGVLFATMTRSVANKHLTLHNSTSHVRQQVEWLYAFDIHCNSFFPLFMLLYVLEFFLLPLVLTNSFISFIISNTLFAIAFSWYFFLTHLGYRGAYIVAYTFRQINCPRSSEVIFFRCTFRSSNS
jgi:hypothetical protein